VIPRMDILIGLYSPIFLTPVLVFLLTYYYKY
jgi:hypothetical protein